MHTMRDNGNGTWDVGYHLPDGTFHAIEAGWNKNDARSMVHFLNGGPLDSYGGQVAVERIDV